MHTVCGGTNIYININAVVLTEHCLVHRDKVPRALSRGSSVGESNTRLVRGLERRHVISQTTWVSPTAHHLLMQQTASFLTFCFVSYMLNTVYFGRLYMLE
jgi:hypothetical protein